MIRNISKEPKYKYIVDLIEISPKLKDGKNSNYILSIIDRDAIYSKIKKQKMFWVQLKILYIKMESLIIHSYNGKKFCNKFFEKYCQNNDIKIIRGRPYHPKSQGLLKVLIKK